MINQIFRGDCREILKQLPDNSIDSVVTDPPYELGFMGKSWDATGIAYNVDMWKEVLRVLKPGGHLLSFGGTRTYHRMACAIEDAGFEIRDQIQWLYGSGFPKSLDISKSIDKMAGRLNHSVVELKHKLINIVKQSNMSGKQIDTECCFRAMNYLTLPKEGKRPDPWVNVLPSIEKWQVMKRVLGCKDDISKELDEIYYEAEREIIGQQTKARNIDSKYAIPSCGSDTKYETWDITEPSTPEAQQWNGWGTALKPANEPICLARKPLSEKTVAANVLKWGTGGLNIDKCRVEYESGGTLATNPSLRTHINGGNGGNIISHEDERRVVIPNSIGRWPANVILDEDVAEVLDEQSGISKSNPAPRKRSSPMAGGGWQIGQRENPMHNDLGGASRFYYVAKASKKDRGEGNTHPTVKPIKLMEYLVRMATPPGGVVLDPFAGSGSTLIAAKREGLNFIGIEKEEEYVDIAKARVNNIEQN